MNQSGSLLVAAILAMTIFDRANGQDLVEESLRDPCAVISSDE